MIPCIRMPSNGFDAVSCVFDRAPNVHGFADHKTGFHQTALKLQPLCGLPVQLGQVDGLYGILCLLNHLVSNLDAFRIVGEAEDLEDAHAAFASLEGKGER